MAELGYTYVTGKGAFELSITGKGAFKLSSTAGKGGAFTVLDVACVGLLPAGLEATAAYVGVS